MCELLYINVFFGQNKLFEFEFEKYNNNIRTYIALLYHLSMISKRFTELLIIIPVSWQHL